MKILIIGMGPGNGMSIAKRFGREGFEVLMIARDKTKLKQYGAELMMAGIRHAGYAVNIGRKKAYSALLKQLASEHPDLDVLHYNASAYNPALPSEMDYSVFQEDLQINIGGALQAVQAFVPLMKKRGKGTIFFTGGGSAFKAPPELFSLSIGKAGMRNLALSVAKECAPAGIRVATITIHGMVKPGTKYDPDLIANEFWQLYKQPSKKWKSEVDI
ncbi:MAG: SDR family NAD(P)-dependent oxidoreductase [Bacteroidetes bacterium]|nr:MAG: SDR family NAD(P)-dependent oxidoreductase [Bacteroidota bacterium]